MNGECVQMMAVHWKPCELNKN